MRTPQNLLFITTDQQRQDSLPCYGLDFIKTPNLNRLANEGTVFNNYYTSSPVCVPARSTLMTGRYASSLGTISNDTWIAEDTPTWPKVFSEAGYQTAAIGKMHFAPWDILGGFQERIICEDKRHWYLPDDHAKFLETKGKQRIHPKDFPRYFETCGAPEYPYEKEFYPDVYIADQATRWLEQHWNQPFATWVSFLGPHDPYDPPEEYIGMYEDAPIPNPIPKPEEGEKHPAYKRYLQSNFLMNSAFRLNTKEATPEQIRHWRANYYANISIIDEGIGKILQTLEKKGILDRTTIVFMSDHGDALGDHGHVYKSFFYESMVKVPLIVREGSVLKPQQCNSLVNTTAIVPYFFDVCNVEKISSLKNWSLKTLLDNPKTTIQEVVFSEMSGYHMVYDGRYKYVYYRNGDRELYDHANDPNECQNLSANPDLSEEIDRLQEHLLQHMMDCQEAHMQTMKKSAYPPRQEMERAYREKMT